MILEIFKREENIKMDLKEIGCGYCYEVVSYKASNATAKIF
jgi:hypothetical protein